jgi:type I site-specific restriction-modification system R (restriction) subunit
MGLTRQLHFSPKHEKSLDVALSVNGMPVVTPELKNPLTGQTAEDAIRQYRQACDSREHLFAFTATPKHKTLAVFGRNGEPFYRYTIRQAIEEGVYYAMENGAHVGTYLGHVLRRMEAYYSVFVTCCIGLMWEGETYGTRGASPIEVPSVSICGTRRTTFGFMWGID